MYWKAITDMLPTEFILDLVVLYLVVVFAKDSISPSSDESKRKSDAINSIA